MTHWGYGVLGGAVVGTYYGDSWEETVIGGFAGSPWGAWGFRAVGRGTAGTASFLWKTRAATAARASMVSAASTVGMYASAVALGYTIGAAAGILISQAAFGDSGRQDAIDLYTGQVKWSEYRDTVGSLLA